jgi:hypothetical protein
VRLNWYEIQVFDKLRVICYMMHGMKFDTKKILERVGKPKERKRKGFNLYLDSELFERFKKACEGAAPSKVVTELIKVFVENSEKSSQNK